MEDRLKAIMSKAEERRYSLNMQSGDGTWYSFMHDTKPINLQVWVDTEEFELVHMKRSIKVTTSKCGSFMNDEHFKRIEREIRKIVFNLIGV